jgi:hypothetical protein
MRLMEDARGHRAYSLKPTIGRGYRLETATRWNIDESAS